MISAVDMTASYVNRKICQVPVTKRGVAFDGTKLQFASVLNSSQLLARLSEAEIKNVDIARALGIPESRVSEMRAGKRRIKLDEAVKLVDAFDLDPEADASQITPLTMPIARLLVLHVAQSLRADLPEETVADLAADLRAFALFASDPQVRDSLQAADGFLQALRIRRKVPKASPPLPRQRPNH
jgi:predicted XRE-type DNA-binding protein